MAFFRRVPAILAIWLVLVLPVRAADTALAECWQGLSPDNALWQECPLGDYVADAVRSGTGAQIALIPAELLSAPLVGDGAITEADLQDSIPENCGVRLSALTGPALKELLENGASHWVLTDQETLDPDASAYGGYLQISGFSVTLDASAPVGQRVVSAELDGQPIPLEDSGWTVLAALPEGLDISGDPTALGLRDLVEEYLLAQGTVEPPAGDRVRVIGAHQRQLISYVPPGLIGIVVVLFALGGGLSLGRRRSK